MAAEHDTQAGFASDLADAFQLDSTLLCDICSVLDRMHGCTRFGAAMLFEYSAFLQYFAERSIRCGQGGPAAPVWDTLDVSPSSRLVFALVLGKCGQHAIDKPSDSWEGCCHQFVSRSRGSKRTGGIFVWFCKHGICYCFYIIPNAEGRDEAFSFLFKYFPVAPKVVVYEFACALQDYCMNRQPSHFKDTL